MTAQLFWNTITPTKRMVYFERADEETELDLIEHVEWAAVKAWFQEQARQIAKSWIE